jgi:hypothetical protein
MSGRDQGDILKIDDSKESKISKALKFASNNPVIFKIKVNFLRERFSAY